MTSLWRQPSSVHRRCHMAVSTTSAVLSRRKLGRRQQAARSPLSLRRPGRDDAVNVATAEQARGGRGDAAVEAFASNRRTPACTHTPRPAGGRSGTASARAATSSVSLMTLETGKPIRDSLMEVDRALLAMFGTAAEEAVRINGEVIPLDVAASGRGRTGRAATSRSAPPRHQPFNFPLTPARKSRPRSPPANTVIAKPTSKTPLTLLKLAESAHGGRAAPMGPEHHAHGPRGDRAAAERRRHQDAHVHRVVRGRMGIEKALCREEARPDGGWAVMPR